MSCGSTKTEYYYSEKESVEKFNWLMENYRYYSGIGINLIDGMEYTFSNNMDSFKDIYVVNDTFTYVIKGVMYKFNINDVTPVDLHRLEWDDLKLIGRKKPGKGKLEIIFIDNE